MMKYLTIVALVLSVTALCIIISPSFKSEIAFVEINRLIYDFDGMKNGRVEYQEKKQNLNSKIDLMVNQFKNDLDSYNASYKDISDRESNLRRGELSRREELIEKAKEKVFGQLKKLDDEITAGALNQINSFVENYGKEHGFKVIIGANNTGNVMFADESINITELVLKALNEEYNK